MRTPTSDHDAGVAVTVTGDDARAGALAAGTTIGRFEVIERIGVGGMGEVYACNDPELGRKVAVKLVHGGTVPRLHREAQAAAKLAHRNVVTVFDVGVATIEGRGHELFVAMELVEGGTLDEWARGRGWREIVAMYVTAGRGLAAAHAAGLVHRDFKPSNVLITRGGEPKVSDFGLAIAELDTAEVEGTPMYMAPEQRDGGRVDARADLYAFCVALFQAVYGVHPFGERAADVAANAAAERFVEPGRRRVPPGLGRVLRGGLAADPARRPLTMTALLGDLETLLRRRPRRVAFAVVAVAAVAAGAAALAATQRAPAAEPCRGARTEMATVWGPAQRAAIAQAFGATGFDFAPDLATRASAQVDVWSERWIDAHVDACRATRVERRQAEDVMDRRVACLERQRSELGILVDYLRRGDRATVLRAAQLAHGLPPVSACEAPRGSAIVDDPALRDLERRLGEADLMVRSGHYPEGIPIAEGVLAAARQRGARGLAARAGVVLGRLRIFNGEPALAQPVLFDAAIDAQAADLPDIAARAWIGTISSMVQLDAEPAAEQRAYEQARAALDAAGDYPLLAAQMLHTHASYFYESRSDYLESVPLFLAALLRIRSVDPEDPLVPAILDNLGGALRRSDRFETGIGLQREALALRERIFGPEHPDVARSTHNVGDALAFSGHFEEGEQMLRRALALKERTMDPHHPSLSNTFLDLGLLLLVEGKPDEAIALYRRDLELWAAISTEPEDPASAHASLGNILEQAGHHADALAEYRRAQEMFATSKDEGSRLSGLRLHASAVWPLLALGRAREAAAGLDELAAAYADKPPADRSLGLAMARTVLALHAGKRAEAHRHLADAEVILAAHPEPGAQPEAQMMMTRAEVAAADGDRAGAAALAQQAVDRCAPLECRWVGVQVARRQAALLK